MDGEVGPSCDEITAALDAITVRYPTPPFYEADHLFDDGTRGPALGGTEGSTTTGVQPFSGYTGPSEYLTRAAVWPTFTDPSNPRAGERVWAFTAMPNGAGIGSFPSAP